MTSGIKLSGSSEESGLLSPYKVIDLTDGSCLACGKILADLGAEVIKVEPPGGDRARSAPPFLNDTPDPEGSLLCLAYNQGKQGITLDLEQVKGKAIFKSLAKLADAVIESYAPGHLDSLGLSYETLSQMNPGLVLTSITGFGQTGPYSSFKESDLVVTALSGYMSLCGDPDRAPLRVSVPIAFYLASAEAAASSLIALYHRLLTGRGQKVDVSAQQVLTLYTANAPAFWELEKRLITRSGQDRAEITSKVRSPQIWQCKDGWISFAVYGGQIGARVNVPLVAWMDSEGMADDWLKSIKWAELDMANLSEGFFSEVRKRLATFFLKHTKAELYREAIKREIILFPAYTMGEIAADPQLKARGFWMEVEHPELGETIRFPGAFAQISPVPISPGRRAPLLGEHNHAVYQGLLGMSQQEVESLKREGII